MGAWVSLPYAMGLARVAFLLQWCLPIWRHLYSLLSNFSLVIAPSLLPVLVIGNLPMVLFILGPSSVNVLIGAVAILTSLFRILVSMASIKGVHAAWANCRDRLSRS
ncbi:K(+)-insensitive pyrophosphate-energized proton pump [Gossypium arboreum]|uniref:K(+)-insensitive pyrophosphate-energized proton pump n=1 Tax=Gossypium arboreum TaxID=29729 RepID=A0A0B0N267_GOSAR|nr:K(+)-insensitive pyrophosphate-energized proton pump [Gossypium arboreum]